MWPHPHPRDRAVPEGGGVEGGGGAGWAARQLRPARPATRICNRLTSPDQRSTLHNKYFFLAQNIFDTNKHDSCIQKLFFAPKKYLHTLQKYLMCVDPCPEWRAGCKSQHTKEIVIKRLAGRAAGCCGQQTPASGQARLYWAVLGLLVSSLKFNVDDLPRPWRGRAVAAGAGAGIINMPPWLLWTLPLRQGRGGSLCVSVLFTTFQ